MAVYCVSYRIEHYENEPAYTLGCEFIDANSPATAKAARDIAKEAICLVRKQYENAARNYKIKTVSVTDMHRVDA